MTKNLTLEHYRTQYTTPALVQLRMFAERELDDPAVAREHKKIVQVLSERGQNGDPE